MNRTLALASALVLLAACSKGKTAAESAAAAAKAAAETAANAAAEAAHAAKNAADEAAEATKNAADEVATEAKEAKLELTDAMLKKYIAYQQKSLAAVEASMAEYKKSLKKIDKADGITDVLAQTAKMSEVEKALEADQEKMRNEVGLTEAEVDAMHEVVTTVMTQRLIYEKAGGDAQLAQLRKNMEKELAAVPAESREAARTQLEEVARSFESNKNASEARKEYGDATVDLVLGHEKELAEIQNKMLQIGIGAMQ